MHPPPGYGEVPFWWWSGDDLDVDRLIWQVRELHKMGISGFQVNYSHHDTPGWPTDAGEPALFTEAWWKIYSRISEECRKLGMGIGISTYTLDWPNGAKNVFYDRFYSKPELNAMELVAGNRLRLSGGETGNIAAEPDQFAARAYAVKDGMLQPGGIDLADRVRDGRFIWTAPEGEWELWTFRAVRKSGSLNPLLPGAGETVVRGFFQPFEDYGPGTTSEGLNFFFNDELEIGLGKFAWHTDFAEQFHQRKGYDLFNVLPAMWEDMGDITPKVRIDYADVRMSLMEERYFEPVYKWHASRGILFGCDNHGRGLDPHAYGDYFRVCRWYSAPGHDTPGGSADPIKGKVSSSIANLYQRPRVQLEGYHSLGWGANPEQLMFATRENYLYGCNLFSLHGFYYTTFGSHWEWAPPCYHFRMPYWKHMGTFLGYFERLSYVMSQGHHVCDIAVIYPVTPYEAEMNGDAARDTAFELGRKLLEAGMDFNFIDDQSIARAGSKNGHLVIESAQASYKVLVFPKMEAARWSSLQKAAAFAESGGLVLSVGDPPSVSDRVGRNDVEMEALNRRAFRPDCRFHHPSDIIPIIRKTFEPDFQGLERTVRAQHRRVGLRDVYFVMDAQAGEVVAFRAKGKAELWDPWTGEVRPLRQVHQTETITQLELPLQAYEVQLVVFTPGEEHVDPEANGETLSNELAVEGEWRVAFEPTMDNRYGDFRLPVTERNKIIGLEARRFLWARETGAIRDLAMRPDIDASSWQTQLHGYGPKFFLLGPVPSSSDPSLIDAQLAALERVDPCEPVIIDGQPFHWRTYEFSWRYGKEGDPGHQGFHGLKGTVSEHFIRLGKSVAWDKHAMILTEEDGGRYYLWTTVVVDASMAAEWMVSRPADPVQNTSRVNAPATVFLDGRKVEDFSSGVVLESGPHPLLLRYEDWGESHVVLRHKGIPLPENPMPVAMRWYKDPGVLPFDPFSGDTSAEWFRFLAPPGTVGIRIEGETDVPIRAWLDGQPMVERDPGHFEAQSPAGRISTCAVRVSPAAGCSGGAAIPEPITVDTVAGGIMPLGDWSKLGILHNYSGGVRYMNTFQLTAEQAIETIEIDLGHVVATAEVRVNDQEAGVRVAPPWRVDISDVVRPGQNELEVVVYNTLANHYQTVPSFYKGDPASGLFGPVRLSKVSLKPNRNHL